MKPNSSKNLLLYTSYPIDETKIAPIPLALGDTIIPPSDSVKNLGVIPDSSLSMVAQISRVCKINFFKPFEEVTLLFAATISGYEVMIKFLFVQSPYFKFKKNQVKNHLHRQPEA